MFARHLRWTAAGLLAALAVLAGPSRSEAGIGILVEEIDSGGAVVPGSTMTFSGSTVTGYSTPNFSNINISINSTSGSGPASVHSLTTSLNLRPASSGFDASHQLRVVVTDNGFLNSNPNGMGTLLNNAGASSGISGGQNMLTNQSQLFSGANPLGPPSDPATDVRPGTPPPGTPSNSSPPVSIPSTPGAFSIQQTIYVKALVNPGGTVDPNSTLGGSASSVVTTSAAVPGPGGLALALAAIPVLGLRRVLRRKAAAPTA